MLATGGYVGGFGQTDIPDPKSMVRDLRCLAGLRGAGKEVHEWGTRNHPAMYCKFRTQNCPVSLDQFLGSCYPNIIAFGP